MTRAARVVWMIALFLPAGCARDEEYLEVYRAQKENYKELGDILATVKDEQSMAEAKSALDERAKKFEAVARKASALPKPPPAAVAERVKEDAFAMERTLQRLREEIRRIREKVKGGDEFLKQFESQSPGLFSAVQR